MANEGFNFIWICVVLGVGLIFVYGFCEPKIIGWFGEKKVRKELKKIPWGDYITFNDVIIKTQQGKYQIDHLILCPYGIFVIETMTHAGWIQGEEESEYWTKMIYKEKLKFKNPLKQNWRNICTLKEVLKQYKDIDFYSVVIFSENAILKDIDVKSDVIYLNQLYDILLKHRGLVQLNSIDIQQIISILGRRSENQNIVKTTNVEV